MAALARKWRLLLGQRTGYITHHTLALLTAELQYYSSIQYEVHIKTFVSIFFSSKIDSVSCIVLIVLNRWNQSLKYYVFWI